MSYPSLCVLHGNFELPGLTAIIPTLSDTVSGIFSYFSSKESTKQANAMIQAQTIAAQQSAEERKKLYYIAGGAGVLLTTFIILKKKN